MPHRTAFCLERVRQKHVLGPIGDRNGFSVRARDETRTWIKPAIERPEGPRKRKADLIWTLQLATWLRPIAPAPLIDRKRHPKPGSWENSGKSERIGAQKKTRTSTPFRELAPEASASTNSAIWATGARFRVPLGLCQCSLRRPADKFCGSEIGPIEMAYGVLVIAGLF